MTLRTLTLLCTVLVPHAIGQGTEQALPKTALPEALQLEIEFLSPELGGKELVGPADDEFFAKLYPREIGAMTRIPRGNKSREECRAAAREFFRSAALEFTSAERDALTLVASRVREKFGVTYPRLVHQPWRFIKTRQDLCGGFSFTRSNCIVLSKPTLAKIIQVSRLPADAKSPAESLLLHEQMHILQRTSPALFKPLYEEIFSFQAAKVRLHPWIDERQVTNPDGVSDDWVAMIRQQGGLRPYWIGTLLLEDRPLHVMGRDFTAVAVPLTKNDDGGYDMSASESAPAYFKLADMQDFTGNLPIRNGYDHPNEVAAYLFTAITHKETTPNPTSESTSVLRRTAEWFKIHLRDEVDETATEQLNEE